MLYKNFLVRTGNPLNEEAKKCKTERARKKNPKSVKEDASDTGDDEDEPELVKCEQEWWRKPEPSTVI
jgi:hypothetical protein